MDSLRSEVGEGGGVASTCSRPPPAGGETCGPGSLLTSGSWCWVRMLTGMRRWGGDGDGDSSLVCGGGVCVKLIVIMTLRHPHLNTEAAFFSWGKIFMRDCPGRFHNIEVQISKQYSHSHTLLYLTKTFTITLYSLKSDVTSCMTCRFLFRYFLLVQLLMPKQSLVKHASVEEKKKEV